LGNQEVFGNLTRRSEELWFVHVFRRAYSVTNERQVGASGLSREFFESVGDGGKRRLLAQHRNFFSS